MIAMTRRDLTIIPGADNDCLVIACDSCGAIGMKDGDVFKLPPRHTAKFTARVALTEVMCSGALPVAIANGVACEMNPTGRETIAGILDELNNAGISDIILTGSTEENFVTNMTALAVTVIGTAREGELKFGKAEMGDKLILFGKPCVGDEVDLDGKGFYPVIRRLLPMRSVKEIIPVGSRGITHEVESLALMSGMEVKLHEIGIDYYKSAGPVTCLLALCEDLAIETIFGWNKGTNDFAIIGEII